MHWIKEQSRVRLKSRGLEGLQTGGYAFEYCTQNFLLDQQLGNHAGIPREYSKTPEWVKGNQSLLFYYDSRQETLKRLWWSLVTTIYQWWKAVINLLAM
jgi:hypothetical protein